MASKEKSRELIPLIIKSDSEDSAIDVLNKTLEALYLTSNYTDIVHLKDRLNEYKKKFKEVTNNYRELAYPKDYEDIIKTRSDLNFLYRDLNDELTFEINRLKIYYEEYKTVQRFESMDSIKDNKEVAEKYKAKSASALRDIVGADPSYVEYVSLYTISYGLWQELGKVLESIRLFTDTMASEAKRSITVDVKDSK